jgi:hypothetical protein
MRYNLPTTYFICPSELIPRKYPLRFPLIWMGVFFCLNIIVDSSLLYWLEKFKGNPGKEYDRPDLDKYHQ